ncbi:TetR/AcrR family transcriptional regulator [Dermacoccaceae bacterium W4C1]
MTTRTTSSYHHGDLPNTLVRTAITMLDEDGGIELSLRAVARRAGVSSAAPYNHFTDRISLLSAIAANGYTELLEDLAGRHPEPADAADLADLAVAYVHFALVRPGLFRVMFAEGCDHTRPDRVSAVADIEGYLGAAVKRAFDIPQEQVAPLATGLWAVVHGLAFLHLDGKLGTGTTAEIEQRVRDVAGAVLSTQVLR